MAHPELQPQTHAPPEVQHVPQTPEIPADVEQETGMQAVQTHPQKLQTPEGQVLAEPVSPIADSTEETTVTIPAQSQAELEQMSKGDSTNTSTWFGVGWLRRIKQAVVSGKKVIFGK